MRATAAAAGAILAAMLVFLEVARCSHRVAAPMSQRGAVIPQPPDSSAPITLTLAGMADTREFVPWTWWLRFENRRAQGIDVMPARPEAEMQRADGTWGRLVIDDPRIEGQPCPQPGGMHLDGSASVSHAGEYANLGVIGYPGRYRVRIFASLVDLDGQGTGHDLGWVQSNWVAFDVLPDDSAAAEELRIARLDNGKDWKAYRATVWDDMLGTLGKGTAGRMDPREYALLQGLGWDTTRLLDGHLGRNIAGRAYLVRAGVLPDGNAQSIAAARARLATPSGDTYAEVCLDIIGAYEDLRSGRKAIAESVLTRLRRSPNRAENLEQLLAKAIESPLRSWR